MDSSRSIWAFSWPWGYLYNHWIELNGCRWRKSADVGDQMCWWQVSDADDDMSYITEYKNALLPIEIYSKIELSHPWNPDYDKINSQDVESQAIIRFRVVILFRKLWHIIKISSFECLSSIRISVPDLQLDQKLVNCPFIYFENIRIRRRGFIRFIKSGFLKSDEIEETSFVKLNKKLRIWALISAFIIFMFRLMKFIRKSRKNESKFNIAIFKNRQFQGSKETSKVRYNLN